MAKQLFTNNAVSLLATPITATATSLTVMSGHGSMFPQPSAPGEYFLVTLEDQAASVREIIKVTGRAGDTFTGIVRGQESTAPRAWNATIGDDTLVDHRVTAETMRLAMELPEAMPPAGSDTEVQFNSAGAFGASPALRFEAATPRLVIGEVPITWPPNAPAEIYFPPGALLSSQQGTNFDITLPSFNGPSSGAIRLKAGDNTNPGPVGLAGSISLEAGSAANPLARSGSISLKAGAGGNAGKISFEAGGAERLVIQPGGDLEVSGSSGSDGYVLTSHGPGTPPTWEPAGTGSGTAWINGANTGPTGVPSGSTVAFSTVSYSNNSRSFKFLVSIRNVNTNTAESFEVLAVVDGNVAANTEVVSHTRYARVGTRHLGSLTVALNAPSNQLVLSWTNLEPQTVQVSTTRIQHQP